ncbi:MAG: AAA family ATPase [Candidatus Methanofastidiosia archaeon]
MWLKTLEIKNFKSIEDLTINLTPGINVIFGENGTGKTNIVKAILKLLGPTYPGPKSFQKEDYFCLDESKDIFIQLIFSENGEERMLRWDKDSRDKQRLILNLDEYINDLQRDKVYIFAVVLIFVKDRENTLAFIGMSLGMLLLSLLIVESSKDVQV